MKNKVIFSIIILRLISSCSNDDYPTKLHKTTDKIHFNSEKAKNLLHNFYKYYALIIRVKDTTLTYEIKEDSINYYWHQILKNESNVRHFLIDEVNYKSKNLSVIYGDFFLRKLPIIGILPNNIHILFWLKVLDEKDYLYGRRFKLGSNLYPYIQNPKAIYPIFNSVSHTLPKIDSTNSYNFIYLGLNPFLDDTLYTNKVDSVINYLKEQNIYTLENIDIKWMNYESWILKQNIKTTNTISKYLLGNIPNNHFSN